MKRKIKSQTLFDALTSARVDSLIKKSAINFLRLDWRKLTTTDAFLGAYDGIAACQKILGTEDCYRKQLTDLRRTLDKLYTEHCKTAEAEYIKKVQEIIPTVLEKLQQDVRHDRYISYYNWLKKVMEGK